MTTDKNPLHEADGLRHRAVMLVGPPGVGKGTQGKLLAQIPGIFHVSSGDMFRELDPNSKCGQIFQEYASVGKFVPDEITIKIWQDYMATKVRTGVYTPERDLLILDGIPRNIKQARLIEPYVELFKIICMECKDREVMFERIRGRALKENRIDDAEKSIVCYRWELYEKLTQPMIDHYPQELIGPVDPDNIASDVLCQILSTIVPIQKRYFKSPLM